jgi:hypothetical protein
MTDNEDEYTVDLMVALRENTAALHNFATSQGFEIDIEIGNCDECGEDHVEEAWWWGHGFMWSTYDGFTVVYDPDPSDPEVDAPLWEMEGLPEVVLLVDMLRIRFPVIPMPQDWPAVDGD